MTTKKIVEEHQGEIGFTTREAEGSTFWISLPLLSKNS
jgi:signal transduction histidine kinase